MELLYWILEYGKVLVAYGILMFVWPMVLFWGYLKDKSRSVRFAFCVTVPAVLINTVVLGLGLLHILYGWLVALLFYGSFVVVFLRRARLSGQEKKALGRLVFGTYGIRLFCSDVRTRVHSWRAAKTHTFRERMRGHWVEFFTLGVVVLFGMAYFTYGAFQDHSYGFGDMYTHHSWIYGLQEGKPFSAGIYPEAMHCIIYTMRVVFGIRVYSILLFLAGIHIAVILVAAYLLLKELFAWRGTPILVLTAFLTVDVLCIDEIFSMSRLQWTLPQEFGFHTQFLCALFLLRCLQADFTDRPKGIRAKLRWFFTNENLLLFTMALAASFAIHFYVTMMAFFICIVIALCRLPQFFRKNRLLPLVFGVFTGLFLAAAPMALALAEGIPFQGSIGWAVNIINGTDTKEGRTNQAQQMQQETQTQREETQQAEEPGTAGGTQIESTGSGTVAGPQTVPQETAMQKAQQKMQSLLEKARMVYAYGYETLYRETRARQILLFSAAGIGLFVLYRIVAGVCALAVRKKGKNLAFVHDTDGYPVLVLVSMLFMLIYAAPFLGLPELIAGSRLCSTEQLLILAVVCIPVDFAALLLSHTPLRVALTALVPAGVLGIYCGTQQLGIFHGYLYNELTRYNAAVEMTNRILKEYEKDTYTVVSTTDELYQMIESGWHEEVLEFTKRITGRNFTIPTEYIFVYVEKKPIQYAQSHFQTGPGWLAEAKYTQYYQTYVSEGKTINASEVSRKAANQLLPEVANTVAYYSNLDNRTILESRLAMWYENFSEKYPQDTRVLYEDDAFACYVIHQNTYRLYLLEES